MPSLYLGGSTRSEAACLLAQAPLKGVDSIIGGLRLTLGPLHAAISLLDLSYKTIDEPLPVQQGHVSYLCVRDAQMSDQEVVLLEDLSATLRRQAIETWAQWAFRPGSPPHRSCRSCRR